MTKWFLIIFIFSACIVKDKTKQASFPEITVNENEWAAYEGRWLTGNSVISFELFLKSGAIGVDSYYRLWESSVADSSASGTISYGPYSTYYGSSDKELRICLHGLSEYTDAIHFRISKTDMPDEMCFITRGGDELIPCDADFRPITTNWRYTLHKRSKLFTVEGYVTFDKDSVEYYERNTSERWKMTELGEFDDIKTMYSQLVKEKYEGIYLKGLAYTVLDNTSQSGENVLVIKRIINFGNDPDPDSIGK